MLSNCPSGLPPPCPEHAKQGNKPTPQQARRAEMNPQTNQKTTKKSTKNQPKWLQNQSCRLSWAPLGASWELLGPSWRQEAPRAENPSTLPLVDPPLESQVGTKNSLKIDPEAYQKVIIFLIACGVGFCCHLVPTWLQLGRQNPPQIQPSWLQDPSKNRSYGFLLARCPR